MNIYEHISSNGKKTFVIMALFPLLLLVILYITLWVAADFMYNPDIHTSVSSLTAQLAATYLPFVALAAVIWMFVSYYSGDSMMLSASGAIEISKEDNPEIYSLVENTAMAAGLPMPKVFVIEDESANAFATGRDPQNSAVALTTGIIKRLNKSELEGVVAHEMSHIGNRDVRLMMVVITGIGVLTFIGQVLLRIGASGRRGGGKNSGAIGLVFALLGLALIIYGVLLAPLIMYALSRRREYQADATAALITRNPAGLASALAKISEDSRVEALDSMPLMSSACIANAAAGEGFAAALGGMFETHPPIKQRIEALMQMDGSYRPVEIR
jgi:heat shock protein HtpX